ncbi:MAG: hypothetical protein OEZ06_14180 [Myxococcales bacterium]|nr:hypothetical protein [Myxococcales bacterium]
MVRVKRSSRPGAAALAASLLLIAAGCAEPAPEGRGPVGTAPINTGTGGAGPTTVGPVTNDPTVNQVPTTTTTTTITQSGTPFPCDVAPVLADRCQTCHGATPVGGAVTLASPEDWHKPSPFYASQNGLDPSTPIYKVAEIRVNDGTMPQGAPLEPDDLAALNSWLQNGAVAGGASDATCLIDEPVDDPTMMNNDQSGNGTGVKTTECETDPTAYDPLVALPGETCWEFPVHGISSPTDTSPFPVSAGESYHEFIYDVPWPSGSIATRFGADFDNLQVLHHWLAFGYTTAAGHGTVNQFVTGTTLGAGAELIAGWAVGGCNFVLPDNMGLELPNQDRKIMIQWHMYNTTSVPQPDATKVQICTVPAGSRPNVGGLTWLGTENLTMGAGINEFDGTCINDSAAPITIVGFLPHLHTIGINMRSEVQRVGSTTWDTVFDQPFQFDYQVHYMLEPALVLQPNDVIKSTCTYNNDTGAFVAFGQSTNAEMCYQFAFSYPAGALDNGVLSLIGATNTCWQFGE